MSEESTRKCRKRKSQLLVRTAMTTTRTPTIGNMPSLTLRDLRDLRDLKDTIILVISTNRLMGRKNINGNRARTDLSAPVVKRHFIGPLNLNCTAKYEKHYIT